MASLLSQPRQDGDIFIESLRGHFQRVATIATSSIDKTVRIWDPRERMPVRTLYSDLTGLRSVAVSPDERRLAAGDDLGDPRKVKIWDLELGNEVAILPGHREAILDIAFWLDGNTIVSVSKDAVCVWQAASFAEIEAAKSTRKSESLH